MRRIEPKELDQAREFVRKTAGGEIPHEGIRLEVVVQMLCQVLEYHDKTLEALR